MLPLDVLQYMYLPCSKHVSCKNLVTKKSPPLMSSAMKLGTCNVPVSEVVSKGAEKVPQLWYMYLPNSLTLGHSIPSACFYLQGLDGVLPLFLDRCGCNVERQVKRNEDIFFHRGIFEKDGAFWWKSLLHT